MKSTKTILKAIIIIILSATFACQSHSNKVIKDYMSQNNISDEKQLENKPLDLYRIGSILYEKGLYRDSIIYFKKSIIKKPEDDKDTDYFPKRKIGISYFHIADELYFYMDKGFDVKDTKSKSYMTLKNIRKYCLLSRKYLEGYLDKNDNEAEVYLSKVQNLLQEIKDFNINYFEIHPDNPAQQLDSYLCPDEIHSDIPDVPTDWETPNMEPGITN